MFQHNSTAKEALSGLVQQEREALTMNAQTECRVCNATMLATTAAQTGGLCMPCSKGMRYPHPAYLSVENFFGKSSSDYCLAPNLEPHPTIAEFKAALAKLSQEPGVRSCIIPVIEFEDATQELEPYADRVFVAGAVDASVIEEWAQQLGAEFYQEEWPGAEVPHRQSADERAWVLVWD